MQVSSVLPSSGTPTASFEPSTDYIKYTMQFYDAGTYQSRDALNAADTELEQFKNDLSAKGATLFLAELNEKKIEELVEKYRQKLLKEQAENPDKPMDIAQMVSDFKKRLLEALEEARRAEAQKRASNIPLSTQDYLQMMTQGETAKTPDMMALLIEANTTARKKEELPL